VNEVHICPILMRTEIWTDGKCSEECVEEDCPFDSAGLGSERLEKAMWKTMERD